MTGAPSDPPAGGSGPAPGGTLPPPTPARRPARRASAAARSAEGSRVRPLLTLAFFVELLVLLTLGLLLAGGPPATLQALLWSIGAVVGLSVIVAAGLPEHFVQRMALHGALLTGSLLFVLPFAWLLGTSFKYPEETFVYPPRWIPEVPLASTGSPYFDTRGLARPEGSGDLTDADWSRAQAVLGAQERDAVAARRAEAAPALVAALAEVERAPASAGPEALTQAWGRVLRFAGLGRVVVEDPDGLALPLPAEAVAWRVAAGDATLDPGGGLLRYDLGGGPVVLEASLDSASLPERVHAVSLSLRQDRTWHALSVALLAGGDAYTTTDRLSMSADGHRELTASLDAGIDRRDLGVFPAEPANAAAAARLVADAAGGRSLLAAEVTGLRITLTPRGPVAAAWAKYTQAYLDAWYADPLWPRYLFNSVWLVALSVIGQIISCSMVAYAFSRLRWRGREPLFGVVLATMMLPPMVVMIPTFLIFKNLGLYNTLAPLWIPAFFGTPFFIFLLRQFMLAIPRDLEEAALIDGCSWFGIYWRIILPLMKPALAAVAIFTFMNVWNEFMGPLIYLSDARSFPLSLGLFNFRSENDSDFAMLMAASTLMTLPVIALFFFCQRYFIEGVTLTGVKG